MTFQKVDQCAPPGPPSGFQCKGNCVNLNNKQKEQQTAETTMLFAIIFQNANLIKAQQPFILDISDSKEIFFNI